MPLEQSPVIQRQWCAISMIPRVGDHAVRGTYSQYDVQGSFAYEQPDRPHDRTASKYTSDTPRAPVLVEISGDGPF